jgi:hypothetical protein
MCRIAGIFLLQRHPPYWLSSKGPNYQSRVLLISAVAIDGHFEGKTPREGHQGSLVLARQYPSSPGTCNPEETGPPYSPDLAPSDYHLFPGLKKNNWNVTIFRPTWRSLPPWRPGRTDNLRNLFLFQWLAKVRATDKEVYWASWGVRWINPEFGRCSLFPSWSG